MNGLGIGNADPFNFTYSIDLSEMPDVGLYDIFNYLIVFRTDYDRRKLSAYKAFDDYRYVN